PGRPCPAAPAAHTAGRARPATAQVPSPPPPSRARTASTSRRRPDMTDRRATTPQEQADFLFDELSAALRHAPEGPADALQALRTADQAFDALHAWPRAGNPLPQPWAWPRRPPALLGHFLKHHVQPGIATLPVGSQPFRVADPHLFHPERLDQTHSALLLLPVVTVQEVQDERAVTVQGRVPTVTVANERVGGRGPQ